jgi:hypothetical protein
MKRLFVVLGLAAALAIPSVASAIELKVTGHDLECAVTTDGTAVTCSGKLSGLGSSTVTIKVDAAFTCTNKAGNTVVGQSSGQSAPIQPENGQVTFTNVTTQSVRDKGCTTSDGHTASFGDTATITVLQEGRAPQTFVVPIS